MKADPAVGRRGVVAAILTAIVVAVAPTGCASRSTGPSDEPVVSRSSPAQTLTAPVGSETSGAATSPIPRGLTQEQRTVDRRDPDQVATAFVVRLEAWDTALDDRPNDAVRRAVAFAGAQLRARLLAGEPAAAPGQRWNQLRRHHGWTSVRTRLGGLGPPPTTSRTAVRAVSYTVVDHGDTGWVAFPGDDGTYIVRLRRSSVRAGWTVVGYTIQ